MAGLARGSVLPGGMCGAIKSPGENRAACKRAPCPGWVSAGLPVHGAVGSVGPRQPRCSQGHAESSLGLNTRVLANR